MKIEKIKKISGGKYKITLDSKEKLITYDEVILKNGLLFHPELDGESFNQVQKDTGYYDIYNKAVKMIVTRLRSEHEIRLFFKKKEVPSDDLEKIVDHLKAGGLINDASFAEAYLSDQLRLTSHGPMQIKEDLYRHKIPEAVVLSLLDTIDQEQLEEKLTKLLVKKINLNHKHSSYLLKQKLVGEFIHLGYDRDLILSCYPEQENIPSMIEKEYQKCYLKLSKKYKEKDLYYQIKQKLYQKGYALDEISAFLEQKNREL